MRMRNGGALALAATIAVAAGSGGCAGKAAAENDDAEVFPIGSKNLLPPELFTDGLRVAVGQVESAPYDQPIAFPHDRHVKTLGLDCQYCHSGVRKGIHAGVPSTKVCMGCHSLVDTAGRPELDKLKDYAAKGEIPWVKVHDLPDFVYFSHKRHVTAGLECTECHGEVQEMGVVQRAASLKMGWCLDCHAQHESIDTNYGTKAELRRAELKDCWTCHK